MAGMKSVILALALLAGVDAKVYFKEQFNDDKWESRWVASTFPGKSASDMGAFEWTAGEWYGDENDKGIKTSQDAKHYGLSAMMDKSFTQKKDLVIQYTVKHEQKLDCGGAYIKIGSKADQKSFSGDTPYQIMFGPDMCGSTKRTHVIFNYPAKDENLEAKSEIKCETDQKSHLYTLHIKADASYEVFIDEESKQTGKLEEGWDFLLPKEIKDPKESKPEDWVDAKKIADPEEVKPEGYDDIPAQIADPEAEMPDDWDEEDDGEWEPPMISNPDYKGEWKPTMIDNPDYKGPWEHPLIANPDFKDDKNLFQRCKDCAMIGFELWQVKSGTMFDDIIVTDSLDEAKAFAKETFFAKKDAESEMFDNVEEERKAAEKAEREAKKAAKDAEEEDEEEEEEHDEL
eukprot:CAMPEP_0182571430 /NCGR_PEP_ID=MMETSP1324-20130603/13345_1 /TAXON_ID=236786 /ORGANISM="Florenciella sp., Strain RCC1587" /LENGTH=400 /DNA_ID=CAMNT_0024786035 /DNA_START=31 /DNA_END=1233 /DNA_ORIENTATION=+